MEAFSIGAKLIKSNEMAMWTHLRLQNRVDISINPDIIMHRLLLEFTISPPACNIVKDLIEADSRNCEREWAPLLDTKRVIEKHWNFIAYMVQHSKYDHEVPY